ncbi:MAG: sulfotransferase family 2 domain-containing protein [Nitrospirota bacterium]
MNAFPESGEADKVCMPQPVIFMHIPKTGGVTLRDVLMQNFTPDETYICDWPQKKEIEKLNNLTTEQKSRIKLYVGHIGYNQGIHRIFPGNPKYITIMRDPVSRVFSYYHYILRDNPSHPLCVKAKRENLNFFELLVSNLQNEVVRRFEMQNMVLIDALELAKKAFREHFIFVGLLERFDESVILLKRILNLKTTFYAPKNTSPRKNYIQEISNEQRNYIISQNYYDILLYNYAKELFDQSMNDHSEDFYREVEQFKMLNMNYLY